MSENAAEHVDDRGGNSVLSLHGVTFGYEPGEAVVHDLSGEVRSGRICAVIGPNAAGKSTALKLMLGQLEPWSGRVVLGDAEVSRVPALQRALRLSYVPQRGGTSFAFTVREVVEMGRFAGRADPASDRAVARAIEQCDLAEVADRAFATLSGGQQQRVLVARAMAQAWSRQGYAGKAMLLDEPGSHMDLRQAHALMQRLAQEAAQGLAVVIVLHDLNLAARYADDVWLMNEGRLVAAGAWDQVLRPAVLEPVYGLTLRTLTPEEAAGRPVFHAVPSATLTSPAH